jgi:hypothetical protein
MESCLLSSCNLSIITIFGDQLHNKVIFDEKSLMMTVFSNLF